ncbi:type II toxin-antitoxin system VapC family toxin [Microbacterium profundi]|uniref:Ribonuclease VapC n=1 Tax=Microbacterium profundi TaxID=450380 RepID=A0ABV3LFZ0_9MICO
MILYVDASAVVPLVFDEPTSTRCRHLWDSASAFVSARATYVEVAAAIASAVRASRIDQTEADEARVLLDILWSDVSVVELDELLMLSAADCAREFRLRGYDAVHCASAISAAGVDAVSASGDRALLRAWLEVGLTVADVAE